jgi:hypothetical protein|tara:strand:- start:341 stop:604 length:264 start_codon:yes stop_codon:yes gene_type:complete
MMGWEEELVNLDSNIWNILHVQKYLDAGLGEGKWEKIDYRGKYRWSNNDVIVEILKPTSKPAQIKIIRDGEKEIKSTWNLKDIKEMI